MVKVNTQVDMGQGQGQEDQCHNVKVKAIGWAIYPLPAHRWSTGGIFMLYIGICWKHCTCITSRDALLDPIQNIHFRKRT